jgi:hypothetical protein
MSYLHLKSPHHDLLFGEVGDELHLSTDDISYLNEEIYLISKNTASNGLKDLKEIVKRT